MEKAKLNVDLIEIEKEIDETITEITILRARLLRLYDALQEERKR